METFRRALGGGGGHRAFTDAKKQAECAELLLKHGARTSAEPDTEAKQDKVKE